MKKRYISPEVYDIYSQRLMEGEGDDSGNNFGPIGSKGDGESSSGMAKENVSVWDDGDDDLGHSEY